MYGLLIPAAATVALFISASAHAADALKFGAPPSWVVSTAVPPDANAPAEAPVAVLLNDEQIAFEKGRMTKYSDVALKIQTDQGLAAGNISIPWNPATDTVTIHKLDIRRGDEVIDVLATGQTFTTVRREVNLEAATLDGQLTANIQPEGLRVGDIIHIAMTTEHSDPVLKDHVGAVYADWNAAPIRFARTRLIWPREMSLKVRQSASLAKGKRTVENGRNVLELSMANIEPPVFPKDAPARFVFAAARLGEASNFASWGDVANLLTPAFREAATVSPSGPLRDEIERIRNATSDPVTRTEQALTLVQSRIRYVALVMGSGSYVPAKAEITWSRRYGECKAKAVLLMAILKELGIEAEAILVNSTVGDAIAERLPMLAVFDHVVVRARIAGKSYWLDGTRMGDASLADLSVPSFGWGLPLAEGSELVRIAPEASQVPSFETRLTIDLTGGVYAPGTATVEQVLRGDAATDLGQMLSAATTAQREEFLRSHWKHRYDFLTVKSVSFRRDESKREVQLSASGEAKLDWSGGWFHVPNSSVGAKLDLERPPGPLRDAPISVTFPAYERAHVAIEFPKGFFGKQGVNVAPIEEVLAGVEYRRTAGLSGDRLIIEASQRSMVSEVPYAKALAEMPRLAALADEDVALRLPPSYRTTELDRQTTLGEKPASAQGFIDRGITSLDAGDFAGAVADFTQALSFEPKNPWALANRGIAKAWMEQAQEAEKDLSAAETIDPDNPVATRARGLLAEQIGDFEAAVEAYTESLQFDPKSGFALERRAAAYRALDLNEKALADTEQALNAGSDSRRIRLLRANILRSLGDSAGALKEADLLLQEHPEDRYALVAAAKIYAALSGRDRAMQLLDKAVATNPKAYIYLNRAQVRAPSDKEGQLADIDAALKLEPDNSDGLTMKALLLSRQGEHKSALAALAALENVNGADERGYFRTARAIVLHRAGRVADSNVEFQTIRATAKTAADFNNLCWTKATAGILLESALEDCREALRLAPESGPYLDSLGMVLLRLGRLEEALAAYDKAVAKRTGSASLMGRALVHARRGDTSRAQADRAEALKTSPDIEEGFTDYGLRL